MFALSCNLNKRIWLYSSMSYYPANNRTQHRINSKEQFNNAPMIFNIRTIRCLDVLSIHRDQFLVGSILTRNFKL